MNLRYGVLSLLWVPAGWAHVISMSSGFATVTGSRVEYILRMPNYEIASLRNPQQTLFDHITFTSDGERARRISQECHGDPASVNLVCAANYEFTKPIEKLGVECSFYQVTVENHIHVLRAELKGKTDRAILDAGFPSAVLTFRPPTAIEAAIEQFLAGIMRVASGPQLLLLAALALASRKRRELAVLCLTFVAADSIAVFLIPRSSWQPSPRLAEEATALALTYLAVEMFFFPESRGRWLFALIFGAFSGFYLSTFLTEARYPAPAVLSGSAVTAVAVFALFGAGTSFIPQAARRYTAIIVFAAGCAWFAMRLGG